MAFGEAVSAGDPEARCVRSNGSPLGTFVSSAVVPESAARGVRARLVDTLAVAIGARNTPEARFLDGWADALVGTARGKCTDWSRGRRWPADLAAHLNGAYAHLLDYDDSTSSLRLHPSAVILPALLALAETRGSTLAEVGRAYAVGYQAMSLLAPEHLAGQYERGWHITTTLGACGAAAACAHLLRLPASAVDAIFGFLAAGFGASRVNFGTIGKPYQVGAASAGAVRAALMAETGALSGPFLSDPSLGLGAMYAGHAAADLDLEDDGWAILTDPPRVKVVPACFGTHYPVAAAQHLHDQGIAAVDIAGVRVQTNATGLVPLIDHLPLSPTEARFSLPYVLARVLRTGEVRLSDFTADGFAMHGQDPLLSRITAEEAPGAPFPRWAQVHVTTHDGATVTARCDALPSTESGTVLADKLNDCLVAGGLPPRDVDGIGARLVAAVDAAWTTPVSALIEALRHPTIFGTEKRTTART